MQTYIALLRGVNVGGQGKLPMKELVAILAELGLRNVTTYIQSGNAVFQSARTNAERLSKKISGAIQANRGFQPHVLILSLGELERAIESNPFPDVGPDDKSLHLGVLDSTPRRPDIAALEQLRAESERFALVGRLFYLHAPDGVGRSKLAAKAEKLLGAPMTDRNWRTIGQLLAIGREMTLQPASGTVPSRHRFRV